MELLKSRREKEGLWSTSKLENATLDESHMEYLISVDPVLRGNCSVINYSEALSTSMTIHLPKKIRHGYLLGCSSHWIAGCLVGDFDFLVADSHNKPLATLKTPEMSFALANQALEDYRLQFRAKMKEVDRYKHYPDSVLDQLLEDGIPEYWKGQVIDRLWWTHRPIQVRKTHQLNQG